MSKRSNKNTTKNHDNDKEDRGELVTIKIYNATKTELLKISSVLQLESEERVSIDQVIRYLINYAPPTTVRIERGTDAPITVISDSSRCEQRDEKS